ncbi:hypothetical protein ABIE12_003431 [Serratia sp. 509]
MLKDGDTVLKADLLSSRDVVVKPGGDANLNMPMEEDAQFVAVVGLFRHPDMVNNTWKQVIQRDDLDPDKGCVEVTFHDGGNVTSLGRLFMRSGTANNWTFTPPGTLSRPGQCFDESTFFSLILALLP